MKRLVVNADDFGLTEMVNQGILECHQKGIVTSASLVANRMMSWLSGVRIHDFGTTFKAYRRDVLREIRLYSGHHRFIPALASWFGANITEIPIRNVVRARGKSSYGLSRTLKVLMGLISIKFLLDYSAKPLQLFGTLGLAATAGGSAIAAVLGFDKLVFHEAIMVQHGPLLFVAMLLILAGIQFLSLGLVADMLARTYFESRQRPTYAVREIIKREDANRLRQEPEDQSPGSPSPAGGTPPPSFPGPP